MKKYISGLVGGFLGGLVASIPWIVLYVYFGFMISFLAALIAMGVNYGYRLFKGPVDMKLPRIIQVLSIITVLFVTIYLIPTLIVLKEFDFLLNPYGVFLLYTEMEFLSAIAIDLVIAIIFTVIGIKSVLEQIKKEVSE